MHMDEDAFREEYGFDKPQAERDAVVVYCRAGVRSQLAAQFLREQCGFRQVYNYAGSADEWFACGGSGEGAQGGS